MHIPFLFEGNCPVYNYQFGENVAASYYNCSAFRSGCPSRMFHSKNVFQCKFMYIALFMSQKRFFKKCVKFGTKPTFFENKIFNIGHINAL